MNPNLKVQLTTVLNCLITHVVWSKLINLLPCSKLNSMNLLTTVSYTKKRFCLYARVCVYVYEYTLDGQVQ